LESPFEKIEGVYEVISGYSGGKKETANYGAVCTGKTAHREVVQVFYDEKKISYKKLLEVFFRQIDPTQKGASFVDTGFQYSSCIYTHDKKQKEVADKFKKELSESKKFRKAIVTGVEMLKSFYPAEKQHQDFYRKNNNYYKRYFKGSGREAYIKKVWKKSIPEDIKLKWVKPNQKELKKMLTDIQYRVTQEEDTEKPFTNKYDSNKKAGLYLDIVSGEPLFLSIHKYDSGTGWPSFWQPVSKEALVKKIDRGFTGVVIEVRSKKADSHLGHVFKDGPKPTGLRYCINSASLRFVPKDKLKKEGFEAYLKYFEPKSDKKPKKK
jgi:peptide methionine sulfoxide reductase msrA/msrB